MSLSYSAVSKITIRTVLGLVILISFAGKGLNVKGFEQEIKTLLLPVIGFTENYFFERQTIYKFIFAFSLSMAWSILASELLIGLMLILDYKAKTAAVFLMGLLCMFSAVLIVNILYPSPELKTCGCFGALWEEPLSWWSVIRNGVLMGLSWAVYRAEAEKEA
ncbi:MAG: MauE/DoxX family redox-associated membrane protein [Cytophagales bacterium]